MGSHYHWHGMPKVAHPTLQQAQAHAAELIARYPADVFNAYRCWCASYHVGHETKPKNVRTDPVAERLVGRLIAIMRGRKVV